MAFKNAQQSRVLIGTAAYSGHARSFSLMETQVTHDVSTLADTAKQLIVGQNSATLDVGIVLDTDTTLNGPWAQATAAKGSATDVPVSYFPAGSVTLSEVFLVAAIETTFETMSTASGTVDGKLSALVDGQADAGVSLEDLTAIVATGNGTARDLTASSAVGGVAHIHVTAFSGFTNNVVTIEHSVDGATAWATLVTFATVTGTTSERVTVASGTTIRRYLRVVDTVTGSGSCTRQVSFARR